MQRLEIAHQMLKKWGWKAQKNAYIWQLPGGQRQRVGIARAGGESPAVITRRTVCALDAFTRDQMQTLLLKLWQETGKQVLLITHDIEEEAVFMATELVLLHPAPAVCWSGCRSTLLAALLRESRAAASSPIHNSSPCANMF